MLRQPALFRRLPSCRRHVHACLRRFRSSSEDARASFDIRAIRAMIWQRAILARDTLLIGALLLLLSLMPLLPAYAFPSFSYELCSFRFDSSRLRCFTLFTREARCWFCRCALR